MVKTYDSKQVNISIPTKLFEQTNKYVKNFGYKNIQELMLGSIRKKVMFDDKENSNLFNDDNLKINPKYADKILSMDLEKDFLTIDESDDVLLKLKDNSLN